MTATAAPSAVPEIARVAMTLAGMAYDIPENLPKHLAEPQLATGGRWKATWIPEREVASNFAFVAASEDENTWAVAVRGTDPGFTRRFVDNVLIDVKVWAADAWDHAAADGARIAKGTRVGLDALMKLTAHGETLVQHLTRTLPAGATLLVTGHSLGGCLASVLALYLKHELRADVSIHPITFAAPSAGDQKFAALYVSEFPSAQRYYNRGDLVPMAWHDISSFRSHYSPGPPCPADFRVVAWIASRGLKKFGYSQPGDGIALPLDGDAPAKHPAPAGVLAKLGALVRGHVFFAEALHRHMPDTYLDHLGAPRLPFPVPPRWIDPIEFPRR